jgi:hypothetical protein
MVDQEKKSFLKHNLIVKIAKAVFAFLRSEIFFTAPREEDYIPLYQNGDWVKYNGELYVVHLGSSSQGLRHWPIYWLEHRQGHCIIIEDCQKVDTYLQKA